MVTFGGLVAVLLLLLWLYCIIDVITTDQAACRNLPKLLWLLIVLLVPDVGSVLWLLLGRPRGAERVGDGSDRRRLGRFPTSGRPVRRVAANPDDDEAFQRALRKRIEEQRRTAREQRPPEE